MVTADTSRLAQVADGLRAAAAVHERLAAGPAVEGVVATASAIVAALTTGGTVLVFGNGGSAADAQHVAAELVGPFVKTRRALAAVALTTDSSILTAVGNDFGFDQVFARQIEALGRRGDVALALTTSGDSANVVKALEAARARGLVTVAFTGRNGGAAGRLADVHVNVPETVTARIQEAHTTMLHLVCGIVDDELEG